MASLALRAPLALQHRPLNARLNSRPKLGSKFSAVCYQQRSNGGNGGIENIELLIGDMLGLVVFATQKQIFSIVLSPNFEGWLAPLRFNPLRFEEYFSLVVTLCGTWFAAGILLGAYTTKTSASKPWQALRTL